MGLDTVSKKSGAFYAWVETEYSPNFPLTQYDLSLEAVRKVKQFLIPKTRLCLKGHCQISPFTENLSKIEDNNKPQSKAKNLSSKIFIYFKKSSPPF